MTISRTLVLDIQATLAELDSYRSLLSYQKGIGLETEFIQSRHEIPAGGGSANIGTVQNVIIVATNNPVTIKLTKGPTTLDFENVTDTFIFTAPIDKVEIVNNGTSLTALVSAIKG